jgi:hypothetical protein
MDFTCGDFHGHRDIHKLNSDSFPEGKSMTKNDYLIQVGDFGLVWDYKGESPDEDYWLTWLQSKPWTTLFIDGNHENFARLDTLPKIPMFGDEVGVVRDGIYHLLRGRIYVINGKKIFTMGGGLSIDKMSRVEGMSWWAREIPNYGEWAGARASLDAHNWEVDYVITHDIHEAGYNALFAENRSYYKDSYVLPQNLEHVRQNLKYKKWFCGHHHIDKSFPQFNTTIMYNKVLPLD